MNWPKAVAGYLGVAMLLYVTVAWVVLDFSWPLNLIEASPLVRIWALEWPVISSFGLLWGAK